jgi:hypothetical protein
MSLAETERVLRGIIDNVVMPYVLDHRDTTWVDIQCLLYKYLAHLRDKRYVGYYYVNPLMDMDLRYPRAVRGTIQFTLVEHAPGLPAMDTVYYGLDFAISGDLVGQWESL